MYVVNNNFIIFDFYSNVIILLGMNKETSIDANILLFVCVRLFFVFFLFLMECCQPTQLACRFLLFILFKPFQSFSPTYLQAIMSAISFYRLIYLIRFEL